MKDLMIFGCTGYTGRLAIEHATSLGIRFIIAGRAEDKVRGLASELNVDYRIFNTDNPQLIDESLHGVRVLLNCAGPFRHTARPLMRACIRNSIHYLDIAAELDSYHLAEELDREARDADVMLMPGCGGSVAMLGCLTSYACSTLEKPVAVDIALYVAGTMSRGSAMSAAGGLTPACLKRTEGKLVDQDVGTTVEFDFDDGNGSVGCFGLTLPDLITIWKSTNISNIQTFAHVDGNALPTGDLASLPDGPTQEQRDANPYHAAVRVTESDGSMRQAVLHTVNGYSFTGRASIEAAIRVLGGKFAGGFQTPVAMFGTSFVESVPGSAMRDIL
jgi:short subunit dehydrogenase-like uncharacterized protein